jgi:hypothetical protein
MEIDLHRNTLLFARMSREAFYRLSFLDNRFIGTPANGFSANLVELLPKCSAAQAKRPLHFILHGAFCGSTLMARHLQELPHCFVLKEPGLLAQLARMNRGASDPLPLEPHSWADWFNVTMALLARGYAADAAVVIKPNDVCNWMGNLLLDHDDRTKIIFLASPLKMFLLSVLKLDERRQWARGRIRQLNGFLNQVPFLTEISVEDLKDNQCSAALWLLNSFLCSSLLARPDSDRIRPLNGEDLLRQPLEYVREAADFFGLASDAGNRAALTALRPLSYHAKYLHLPYDTLARASDRDNAEARFGREVAEAISWAEQVSSGWLSRSPFPVE